MKNKKGLPLMMAGLLLVAAALCLCGYNIYDSQRAGETARQAAQALDQQVEGSCVGGCSDGNLTSALGIPTLDGLGATGEGLHARHEHLYLNEYPDRIALFASLLLRV